MVVRTVAKQYSDRHYILPVLTTTILTTTVVYWGEGGPFTSIPISWLQRSHNIIIMIQVVFEINSINKCYNSADYSLYDY
jgi:hypothetical protein